MAGYTNRRSPHLSALTGVAIVQAGAARGTHARTFAPPKSMRFSSAARARATMTPAIWRGRILSIPSLYERRRRVGLPGLPSDNTVHSSGRPAPFGAARAAARGVRRVGRKPPSALPDTLQEVALWMRHRRPWGIAGLRSVRSLAITVMLSGTRTAIRLAHVHLDDLRATIPVSAADPSVQVVAK
jgi:hypothetical protein